MDGSAIILMFAIFGLFFALLGAMIYGTRSS